MISEKHILQSHLAPTSFDPLGIEVSRAKGLYIFDKNNKRYIDLISGIAVNNIGHLNPVVVKAIRKQLHKFLHVMVYGEFQVEVQSQLAQKLNNVTPKDINSFYFVNSGSEAVEGALKLAKKVTKRRKIVAFRNAYHGSTSGALSMMDNSYYSSSFGPLLPEVYFAEFDNIDSLEIIDDETAAVVVETIQGEAGYQVASNEFYKSLRQKCSKEGALLVSDEIQSGFGRTGTFWAFEQFGFKPDILLMAKGMGGGMPIGCFASSAENMSTLAQQPILGHITTFGGHPLSCAAASATIDYITSNQIVEKVKAKEELFRSLLKHPKIKSISGLGLMLSIELASFEEVEFVMKSCLERGMIIDWFLYHQSKLRVSPPLTINAKQIEKVCRILLKALDLLVTNQTEDQQTEE